MPACQNVQLCYLHNYVSIISNFLLEKLLNVFRYLHIAPPFLYLLAKLLELLWSGKYILTLSKFKCMIFIQKHFDSLHLLQ